MLKKINRGRNKGFSLTFVVIIMLVTTIIILSAISLVSVTSSRKYIVDKKAELDHESDKDLIVFKNSLEKRFKDIYKKCYQRTVEGKQDIPIDNLDYELCCNFFDAVLLDFTGKPGNDIDCRSIKGKAELPMFYDNSTFNSFNEAKFIEFCKSIGVKDKIINASFSGSFNDKYDITHFVIKEIETSSIKVYIDMDERKITFKFIYNIENDMDKYVNFDLDLKYNNIFSKDADIESSPNKVSNLSNYGLVADKNININNSNSSINSSMYAGCNIEVGKNSVSSLNVTPLGSEKFNILARGSLIAYPGSSISADCNSIYVNNIMTAKHNYNGSPVSESTSSYDSLNLSGDIFVSGDTLVNSSFGNVKYRGEYVGYGSTTSSFCINARSSLVNLEDLDSFVLSNTTNLNISTDSTTSKIYETGESLASKYTQSMYLVPDECITTKDGRHSNPVSTYEGVSIDLSKYDKINLLKYAEGYRLYSVVTNDLTVSHYLYLNFKSDAAAVKYAKEYYEVNNSYAKEKLVNANVGEIFLGADTTIKTKGTVFSYRGGNLSILNNKNLTNTVINDITNDNKRIQNNNNSLCSTLELGKTNRLNRSLFDYLVGNKLSNFTNKSNSDSLLYSTPEVLYSNVVDGKTILVSNYDVEVLGDFDGIIITKGNININRGVNITGSLLAYGNININSSVNIKSDDSIVTLIDSDETLKDIFTGVDKVKDDYAISLELNSYAEHGTFN